MNVLPNLKRMIQRMQEAKPIYEDYARKVGLRLSQYPTATYEAREKSGRTEIKGNQEKELEEDPEEDPKKDPEEESESNSN